MKECRCEKPCRSPNPRHPHTCNRCCGRIRRGRLRPLVCSKCGSQFDHEMQGRTGIFFQEGEGLDVLRNMAEAELCPECSAILRNWLGLPDVRPGAKAA